MTNLLPSKDFDRQVLRRIGPVLAAAGIGAADVRCRTEVQGVDLDVYLDLPTEIRRPMRQALAVRVLDAVGSSGLRFGDVEVHIECAASRSPCDQGPEPSGASAVSTGARIADAARRR